VTLVSPSKVDIDGNLAKRRTAGFTKLVMSFVPEPGTLLLLGAGALGLVLMGSRKR
jgi:PEP-CTERM motif